jgi:uncharacterized repeat protein (TIGR03803 family)
MNKTLLFILSVILSICVHGQNVLYGLTYGGGKDTAGVLFSYNTITGKDSILLNFTQQTGYNPAASPMQAKGGLVYMLTMNGGTYGNGTLLSYNPTTGVDSVLINFQTISSQSTPLEGIDGKLYILLSLGGTSNVGCILRYDPVTRKDSVVFSLGGVMGVYGEGSLFQASNGLIYGRSAANPETLFSFDPVSGKGLVCFTYDSLKGMYPMSDLIQANNGLIYGTTMDGGCCTANMGILYSYNPATGKDSMLKSLDTITGGNPRGKLVQASNGLLYGTTTFGTYAAGTIFSYNITNGVYTVLVNFNQYTEDNPWGGLTQASNGILYGMSLWGGTYQFGTLYSFDPITGKDSVLINFHDTLGASPWGNLIGVHTTVGINEIQKPAEHITVYPNPVTSFTNLEFSNYGKHTINLEDITGRCIKTIEFTGNSYKLAKDKLAPGIYLLQFSGSEHFDYAPKKIIIQ